LRRVPVDPDLVRLLEASADRSVQAVTDLRDEVAEVRKAQRVDREDLLARMRALESRVDRYGRELHAAVTLVERVDKRCGALVVEEEEEDGETVIRARPARLGLDYKFVIGAILTLISAGVVPIAVAALT
jgi:hypothetical protein